MAKFKVKKDIWTSDKPNYYKVNSHQDLFDVFRLGLLTHTEYVGFLKACIVKYLYRYSKKNQAESDLNKMCVYANELKNFELSRKRK